MFRCILLSFVLSFTSCMSVWAVDIDVVANDLKILTNEYVLQKSAGELPSDSICSAALYHSLKTSNWELGRKAYDDLQTHHRQRMGMSYSSAFEMFLSICVSKLHLTVSENDVRTYLKMRIVTSGNKRHVMGKIIYETGLAIEHLGDISLTIELFEQFLTFEDAIDPIYFYRYLMQVGWANNRGQMPQKSYMAFRKCAEYYRNKLGMYSKSHADALKAMAYVARYIGRRSESLSLYMNEKEILEQIGDTLGEKYAICMDNIATTYYFENDIDNAIVYAEKARAILEQNGSDMHLAIVYNNLSSYYNQLVNNDSNYVATIEGLLIKSLHLYPSGTAICNLIQLYDDDLNDYDRAEQLINAWEGEAMHSQNANIVANHYALTNDYDKYTCYMKEYIDYLRSVLQKNALFMSAEERNEYVKIFQENNLKNLFELAARTQDPQMAELCFDYLLMTRSLLLSFDSSIKNIIEKTKNKRLRDMYLNLLVHRKSFEAGQISQEKLEQYEHDFLECLAKESNFTDFTNLRMENVRHRLGNKDVTIEFYENAAEDAATLYAIVLTNESVPKVVACCTADEEQDLYEQGRLAEHIVEKLATAFDGKERVFFIPSGKLYTYPFESEIKNRWSDIQFYRLTSSRELVLTEHHQGRGALIYGGLQYGMEVEDMRADSLLYDSKERSAVSPLRYADQIQPLPGTLHEAELIKETYDKVYPSQALLYTGTKGTESSFKANNGKGVRVIHIGTHGFFFQTDDTNVADPLMRTGLLMSGAENYFYAEDIHNGNDDSVLTSFEVSTLDLRGLDLITLSACETAQGDITGDGVFGLQRGFKKAGANSILMSLWKVDDEATCKLMTEFYSNWIGQNMTKHDALEAAKQTVRNTRGWEDPKYWAAFILLDGLD